VFGVGGKLGENRIAAVLAVWRKTWGGDCDGGNMVHVFRGEAGTAVKATGEKKDIGNKERAKNHDCARQAGIPDFFGSLRRGCRA